jgi:site-specific DNA-cytosine methylase
LLESVCRILEGVEAPRALFETRSEFIRSQSFLGAVSRFQSLGFQVEAEEISARQLGYPHGRRRLFLSLTRDSSGKPVANPRTQGLEGTFWSEKNTQENAGGQVTRQSSDRHQDLERVSRITQRFPHPPVPRDSEAWSEILESAPHLSPALPEQASGQFRGVANGFANRLDRLWVLGDDSVPATWFAAIQIFYFS